MKPDISKLGTASLLAEIDLSLSLSTAKQAVDRLFSEITETEDELWELWENRYLGPRNFSHGIYDSCWCYDYSTPRWSPSWCTVADNPEYDFYPSGEPADNSSGVMRINCSAPHQCGVIGCACVDVLPPFYGEQESHALSYLRAVLTDPFDDDFSRYLPEGYAPPHLMEALGYFVEDVETAFRLRFTINYYEKVSFEEDEHDLSH